MTSLSISTFGCWHRRFCSVVCKQYSSHRMHQHTHSNRNTHDLSSAHPNIVTTTRRCFASAVEQKQKPPSSQPQPQPQPSFSLSLRSEYGLFINGKFQNASNHELIHIENPATEEIISSVHCATDADVQYAIACASAALASDDWNHNTLDVRERSHILSQCAAKLAAHVSDIAYMESLQTGRPLREMRAQLARLPEWLEYYAALIRTLEGTVPPFKGAYLNVVRRVPLGVCGLLTPWNHPMLIAIKKIAPALAAGNTVVVKPSELAPCAVLEFAQLMTDCGLPPGVLNVLAGDGPSVGQSICASPAVKKVDLTGGTRTGQQVGAMVGRNLAYYTAELGGKTPMIVFGDCAQTNESMEHCVNGIAFASFIASGQTCIMGSRLLIQESIYDAVLDKLVHKIQNDLKYGNPQNLRTNFGPLINRAQRDKMLEFMQLVNQDSRATVLCGGRIPQRTPANTIMDADTDTDTDAMEDDRNLSKGYFFEPTVIGDCTPEMDIVQTEIFGPIVVAMKFKTEADAIAMANDSQYGLAAAIWTSDMSRAYRVSNALDVGIVWVNDHHRNDPSSPWGGTKQSGIGRENGIQAYHDYTQTKSVVINCNDREQTSDWFAPQSTARYG